MPQLGLSAFAWLAFFAGVGKTYRMLEEAHALMSIWTCKRYWPREST